MKKALISVYLLAIAIKIINPKTQWLQTLITVHKGTGQLEDSSGLNWDHSSMCAQVQAG